MTNKGFVKVPVIWVGAERSYQIKNDGDIRDGVGRLKLPIITLEDSASFTAQRVLLALNVIEKLPEQFRYGDNEIQQDRIK